jgi:hypothetical protein
MRMWTGGSQRWNNCSRCFWNLTHAISYPLKHHTFFFFYHFLSFLYLYT